ncbi:MAG: beta strand repeat-containing protein [Bythopirellula sp.]
MSRRMLIGLQCVFLCLSTASIWAANFQWDGGAGNNLWDGFITVPNLDTNWDLNEFPDSDDSIILGSGSLGGPVTIDLNGDRDFIRIEKAGTVTGDYTFGTTVGGDTLTSFVVNSNALVNLSDDGELILNSNLELNGGGSLVRFNANDGNDTADRIIVHGDVSPSDTAAVDISLSLTTTNKSAGPHVVVNGVISDGANANIGLIAGVETAQSQAVTADHSGPVSVTGANTFSGPVRVTGGTLIFNSIQNAGSATPNALGTPDVADSAISIGDTSISTGTIRYVGSSMSSNTSDRDIFVAGSSSTATIEASGTVPLELNGDVLSASSSTTRTLVLGGSNTGNNTLSGRIFDGTSTGVLNLNKNDGGKWILSGVSNTLDGESSVNGGELVVTGSIGSTTFSSGRMHINSGGTFTLDGGFVNVIDLNNFPGGTFNFRSGELRLAQSTTGGGAGSMTIGTDGAGTLRLNGGSQVFGDVTLQGTDDLLAISAGGTYQFSSLDNSVGGTVSAAVANIQINGGTFTHRVNAGTSQILSRIQGSGGFTKQGAGTVEFAASSGHSYTGPTRVEGGTLLLSGAGGLPDTSPVFIDAGATLDMSTAIGGDEIGPTSGAGMIATGVNSSVAIDTNGQNATFAGSITGAGSFIKRGAGRQILNGANTYTNITSIENGGGTLEIATGGSITGTSRVDLSTATLLVSGGTIDTAGNIRPNSNSAVLNITGGLVKANAIDRTVNSQYLHQFNWSGGTVHLLTAATINGSTLTAVDRPFAGSLTLDSDETLIIDDTLSVTGTGQLNILGGSVTVDDIITGGTINFTLGTMRMRNNQTFNTLRLNALGANTPLIAGKSIIVDAAATITAPLVIAGGSFSAGTIVNPENLILDSGALNVTAGDLDIAEGATVDATSGMTVNVSSGALNVASGGEFNAINATLAFSGGVINDGDVNLINSTVNGNLVNGASGSIALLGANSFSDDLSFNENSKLFIDIAGDQPGEFDTLSIGGNAVLNGNLVVGLDSGFSLTLGDEFEIVDIDGTSNGSFDGLADGALVGSFGGIDLFIDYNAGDGNDIGLFTQAGADVDLDNDGDVDGADFLAIQRTNPALIPNWESQYGSGLPLIATKAAVPEPTSSLLLAVGCTLVAFARRNKLAV